MNKTKTVLCFGTFDILHPGHLHYFKQAKKHGDKLIVVIARDSTCKKIGKKNIFSEQERKKIVESLEIVDEAVLGHTDNHFRIIKELDPDIICLGYDHNISEEKLRAKLIELGVKAKIKRISAYLTDTYKSSLIKKRLLSAN